LALTLLDLCCGMGGWSIGFHREGFDCEGVDVLDLMYPYKLLLADVETFHPTKNYDVVVASPPCTEFSQLTRLAVARGQRGAVDIEKGVRLIRACLRVIEEVEPRFWVLENVAGSEKHITQILGKPKIKRGPWRLWGCFPNFLLPENPECMRKLNSPVASIRTDHDKVVHDKLNSVFAFNPIRSWFRAKIPFPLSIPLAKACRAELENATELNILSKEGVLE